MKIILYSTNKQSIYTQAVRLLLVEELAGSVNCLSFKTENDFVVVDEDYDMIVLLGAGIAMPQFIEELTRIGKQHKETPVVCIMEKVCALDEFKAIVTATSIKGILISASAVELLRNFLQNTHTDTGLYICPILKDHIVSDFLQESSDDSKYNKEMIFSANEFKILKYAAMGMSIAEIASTLNLSPNTIAVYRSKMIRKSGTKSIAQLIGRYKEI